jgi:hypothetical protein
MEVALPEQILTASATDECPHHWMIETPNGETSTGSCKRCGPQSLPPPQPAQILTRSVKPNTVNPVTMSAPSTTTTTAARV